MLVLLVLSLLTQGRVEGAVEADKINVHVVPHTHDDVGWLKTVDQYYYGANNSIQHAGVQYILDSVVEELADDEKKTFIYVEMAFFTRWWNEQSKETQQLVHKLVSNKQLEFINGGWCMNDEASTDYNAIIDQMSLGIRFISDTFGPEHRPRIGWHIDPFGHSAEQASLFGMMGFDGFFFGRIDYDDKKLRLKDKQMEMVWRGSESLGQQTEIFTGVLYNGYGPPGGFCFDQFCADQPIMDDKDLFDYNVDERVQSFLKACKDQASHYRTNNIMLTMGSDFQYENAHLWYKNLDKLIHYVSLTNEVNIFYSTPSRYVDAIHQANMTWEVKTDDFFPYADCPWCYWTGYFTSRVALKGYVRKLNGLLQTCRQLEAMHGEMIEMSPGKLASAMGVAQHHDAVSGTEKQHVANDYAKRLHIGQVECEQMVTMAVGDMAKKTHAAPSLKLSTCEYLNISVCPATSSADSFDIMVYNPVGRQDDAIVVRVPVTTEKLVVMDANSKSVTCQIVPVSMATSMARGDHGSSQYELVFMATAPPLGYNTYFMRPATTGQQCVISTVTYPTADISISNKQYKVTVDGGSGHVKEISNQVSGASVMLDHQFLWYWSSEGNNKNSSQASGAYIFRPNSSDSYPVNNNTNKANITVAMGPVVQEVWQQFASFASQVVRLYVGTGHVEMEYTIGPIPISDKKGKEIISRYATTMATNKMWYTDANGREMKLRVRDNRATWQLNNTEPVAGNYYPVNSRISIQDTTSNTQFTVLTDRSQGGSSLKDGCVELMVHRRILHDDGRGVGEPLNEKGVSGDGLVVRGKHMVIVDTIDQSAKAHRLVGEKMLVPPTILIHDGSEAITDFNSSYNSQVGGLTTNLPDNVHLLTVELLTDKSVLLRVEHMFAVKEDANLSTSVTINVKDMFNMFAITHCEEMTLTGDQLASAVKRYTWNDATPPTDTSRQVDPSAITLAPMVITTLKCEIARKTFHSS
ncbi:lysosomal alpha-mannosidase-like [Dysidea avara]|uniref:lysosomal alpha-mannosidase-like n=1 Tax=Dysidea avara TaxID=196820 RepID=UPI0033347708